MKYLRRKAEGISNGITLDSFLRIGESPVFLPPIFWRGFFIINIIRFVNNSILIPTVYPVNKIKKENLTKSPQSFLRED
jgi:hypothetical protein